MENKKLFDIGASSARLYKADRRERSRKLCEAIEAAVHKINAAYKLAEDMASENSKVPKSAEWLLDNRYLAVREAKTAAADISREKQLRAAEDGVVSMLLCRSLVNSCGGRINSEVCREFLQGVQSFTVLPHKELYLFPAFLRAALVISLSSAVSRLSDDAEEISALISSLRQVSSMDMQSLLESVDVCERLLMSDPAGIYPRMEDSSRAYYRRRLCELAREQGMEEYRLAEKLLETCKNSRGEARHVGFHLMPRKEKKGYWYITANILLSLSVTLLCGFISHSFVAALLLFLPITELTKALRDNIVLQYISPVRLPRLDLSSGVPEEGKTVCVVSALLTHRDSAEKFTANLEDFMLSNRKGGKNLLFGILADLPEAKTAVTDKDAALISSAVKSVEALNRKYGGGFYLFLRPRREDKKLRSYCGFERKRGAVLALAKLLCGKESELRVAAGDASALQGTRFIITLDSDTRPYPDSLTELIGTMLHPLNAPVLDRERGMVIAGHGILHPRMSTTLRSASATDFSRLFAGIGGSEPYSVLCGELYMDLFRRGGFSGKGIIDAECLVVCSEKHLPCGKILSHDAPEGAYLRGGYVSDLEFSDSFPVSPISYYRRSHRWIRGDWQNAGFIFRRSSDLPDIERFRLCDSLRRSLVPVLTFISVFLGLLYPERGLILAASAALLSLCTQLLIAITDFFALNSENVRRRYHSRLFHGLGAAFLRTFVRLWFLPYEAWISLSAVSVSMWRMCLSHKNLLQWETSAQSDLKKRSLSAYVLNMWFAVVSGAVLFVFSPSVLGKAVGLFWICAPLCALALSVPAKPVYELPSSERKYLMGCAADIWSYFESFCTAGDNYLPPDNFQEQPPVGLAHRTSPTNIGLALVSALCALDLGIDHGAALPLIGNMLDTLERMPKWRGHFYNWYDTLSLRPLSPRYISTVDSGNLCASLIALKNGLIEHHRPILARRAAALIAPMDFSPLYDRRRCLFRIGADLEKNELSPAHYDLLAGEARLTGYLAVAKGDVPKKHWRALSRALRRSDGYTGMASWTGTMFEYLMPELFLPLCPDSLIYETARYCLHVQQKRKSPTGVWGISESAFFSLDSALNYRYKAHGCGDLALKRGQDAELVISPYSTFLALAAEPRSAIKNLHRLEETGASGRFGFIEAIDFTASRSGAGGERVRCYMAHHLGMSMLSVTNLIKNGIVTRRFMAEPCMRAYKALLEEKLPLNSPVLRLAEAADKGERKKTSPWTLRDSAVDFENPCCTMLSNGKYNIMSTESGITRSTLGDMLVYSAPRSPIGDGHGAELYFECEGRRLSLLPQANEEYESCLWELGQTQVIHRLRREGMESVCRLAAAGSENGELRFVSLCSDRELCGKLVFSFEPVLADYSDYVNHPAYWRLGLTAHMDGDVLLIRRLPRGNSPEYWLCLACSRKMSVSADRCGALGALSAPYVSASAELQLSPGESCELRFALCVAEQCEAAYVGAQRMLSAGSADFGAIPSMCAARLCLGKTEYGSAMGLLRSLMFPRQLKKPWYSKESLWKYGISGDFPIVYVPYETHSEDIRKAVLQFCLLRLCGVNADLAMVADEGGEYTRPLHSLVRDILTEQGLEPLLDCHGGIHLIPPEAVEAVSNCASAIFGEAPPMRRRHVRYYLPESAPRRSDTLPKYEYAKDGSFVFYVNQSLPSRAWSQLLTNGRFGCIAADSGTGNIWYGNARECKVNPWLNDPFAVIGPETLEFSANGHRCSLFAANDGIPCRVKYGFGYAVWEKRIGDGAFRCTAFVPEKTDARVLIVENLGAAAGQLCWKTSLILSDSDKDALAVSSNYVNRIFHASSARFPYDRDFLIASSSEAIGWTGDELSALRGEYDGKTSFISSPCFAAVYADTPVLILACGFCSEEEISDLCKPDTAFAEFELTKSHWRSTAGALRLDCREKALAHYMSGWAAYQTIACRLMGRSSVYQSGGAFGFRDQLQDAVNLLLISPKYTREQILKCCRHQYVEGDVMHWWHELPNGDRGVRTRCSDDLLWLVWALCEYIEKTDDMSFCRELVNYVNSPVLAEQERDRYEAPEASSLCETVIDHAKRAVDLCISRGKGPHGLLFFGSGDWNDGMDRVEGESVWLSFFFANTVKRFSDLLILLCKPDAHYYRGIAESVCRSADEAWDGAWYLRGYWPDGTALGSSKSEECRIDSLSQSWAAFCTGTSNSRIDMALESALRELYDRENGIVKLFTPPFTSGERNPGYIRSYGAGFRENGGQYTHGAIWLAMACIKRGRPEDGWSILRDLLPENHDLRRYMAEPFVIPADVYSAHGHTGEAGWTWYTGSSGWYFRAVCEELLGLKLWGGRLYIRPALPEAFPSCRIRLGRLNIEINEEEITVNGEKYDGKGIPYGG
ncbi:MAG: glucoamylase family protein [Bacillota bacterium]|nr:glucoamylase family protein [Bacillota bacterium]